MGKLSLSFGNLRFMLASQWLWVSLIDNYLPLMMTGRYVSYFELSLFSRTNRVMPMWNSRWSPIQASKFTSLSALFFWKTIQRGFCCCCPMVWPRRYHTLWFCFRFSTGGIAASKRYYKLQRDAHRQYYQWRYHHKFREQKLGSSVTKRKYSLCTNKWLKSGINAYAFLCTRFVIINTLIYEIIPFKCNNWNVHYNCTFYMYIVKVHFLITFHEQTKNISMATLTMNRLVIISSRYWTTVQATFCHIPKCYGSLGTYKQVDVPTIWTLQSQC